MSTPKDQMRRRLGAKKQQAGAGAANSRTQKVGNSGTKKKSGKTRRKPEVVATPQRTESQTHRDAIRTKPKYEHPLKGDESFLSVDVLLRHPNVGVRELIFEETPNAIEAMKEYRRGRAHSEEDTLLMKSILALRELQNDGITYILTSGTKKIDLTKEEQSLLRYAQAPYNEGEPDALTQKYGLTPEERRSVQAYSSPGKDEEGRDYYMGESEKWGEYQNGWVALASAMARLPTLGRLGMELTTYRTNRTTKETEAFQKLKAGTNIKHGDASDAAPQGHYSSTAISYNSFWNKTADVGGIVAFTGRSGVYINPFGLQGFQDGGEILYPPGILTRYEGEKPDGFDRYPVFHLKEVDYPETGQKVVDDNEFSVISEQDPALNGNKLEIIRKLETLYQKGRRTTVDGARKQLGLDSPIAYLTVDQLVKLRNEILRGSEDRAVIAILN